MKFLWRQFARDEDGAVTVDFVVVTAAVIGLGVMAIGTIAKQVEPNAQNLKTRVTTAAVTHNW